MHSTLQHQRYGNAAAASDDSFILGVRVGWRCGGAVHYGTIAGRYAADGDAGAEHAVYLVNCADGGRVLKSHRELHRVNASYVL